MLFNMIDRLLIAGWVFAVLLATVGVGGSIVVLSQGDDFMQSDEAFELTLTIRTPTGERKVLVAAVRNDQEESDPEGRVYLASERCVELHQAVADAVHWLCRSGVTGDAEPHEELASIVAAIMGQDGAEDETNKAWPLICERMREERVWPKVEMP